ncbi:hypothetical protein [Rufibacter roseus]|uniref:Uncharacterized protein n=1 Tax=Rufibacter roseus TaxID=1567108 RepID=A0ABW2DTA8_9BACT|nr:hypothetical protein [Rufibacter roseus]
MNEPQEFTRPFFPDVESLFSEYVEYYGGTVVEKLESYKTDRQNADFFFEHPVIVAELKTFEKDIFSEPEDIPRLMELFEKWIANGLMTGEDLKEYTFRGNQLPQKCIDDMIERASKTIERAIYKANKQIEETKKTLNKKNANGIVFLINDGNYFFTNQGFLAVISDLIGRKFKESSFDVIIYLTINQATYKEDSELDHTIWVPIYTKVDDQGETIVSDELYSFVNTFGEKFLTEFLTLKTGHKPKAFKQIEGIEESIAEFNKQKFIPKDIIYKK